MEGPRRPTRIVAAGLASIAGLAVVGLQTASTFHLGSWQRHHVETWAVWYVLMAAGSLLLSSRRPPAQFEPSRVSWTMLAAFVAASCLIYFSAFGVGLLSDDFVLLAQVRQGNLLNANPAYFRPVPLLIWQALDSLGVGAVGLHALNIVLHGVNGFLVSKVASHWVRGRWPLVAGGMFLATPLAIEAVAWVSGIFDVMATAAVLSAVLLFRSAPGSAARTVGAIAACLVALLSKEAAIVLPAVLVVDALATGSLTRRRVAAIAAVVLPFVMFAAWRLAAADQPPYGVPTKYVLQRGVFSVFESLVNPWHEMTLARFPVLAIVGAAAAAGVVALVALCRCQSLTIRRAALGLLWTLAACVPVLFLLPVGGDLQSSRYLYLPSIGWVLFVTVALSSVDDGPGRRVGAATGWSLAGVLAVVTVLQLAPWREAGRQRDALLQAVSSDPRVAQCRQVWVTNATDHVAGAYVFRNGLGEALDVTLGSGRASPAVEPPCRLEWDPAALAIKP